MTDLPEGAISAPLSDAERARLTVALVSGRTGTKLEVLLLAGQDGQVWCEATDEGYATAETSDALRALAWRIAAQSTETGQYADHETHFFDWDGRQVIGKWLNRRGQKWLLVLLLPPKVHYKQALTRVIKALDSAFNVDQGTPKPKGAPRKPKAK